MRGGPPLGTISMDQTVSVFKVFQNHQALLTLMCGTTMILEPHKYLQIYLAKVPKRSFFLSLLQLEIVISKKQCGMCFCQTNFHQKLQYIYLYSKLLVPVFYFADLVHTGLIGSRYFQNYTFTWWLFLETMKL